MRFRALVFSLSLAGFGEAPFTCQGILRFQKNLHTHAGGERRLPSSYGLRKVRRSYVAPIVGPGKQLIYHKGFYNPDITGVLIELAKEKKEKTKKRNSFFGLARLSKPKKRFSPTPVSLYHKSLSQGAPIRL